MHNNIMAAGSRDRPPMLATGRYAQWQSRFLRYIDTRPNGDALRKCILESPYTLSTVVVLAVPVTENSSAVPEHTTVETLQTMSPENKAHYESEKEAIHLILTGIGDEIYSTFGNQRTMTVVRARENVGSPVVQQTGIQCFNCKEFGYFSKECRNPKRVKDSTYHKEKMLLCKQAEQGVPLQAEHEVVSPESNSNAKPLEHVQYNDEYNVFANVNQHCEQSKSTNSTCLMEKDDSDVTSDSPDMYEHDIQTDQNAEDERAALANLIANLNFILLAQKDIDIKEGLKLRAYEISVVKEKHSELVKQSLLTKSHYEGLIKEKIKTIQTIHMLAPTGPTFNGRPTFANLMYLKKAQSEKPCLYEIPNDQSDPTNRLVPDREETLTLAEESRSKLNKDFVRPYDYTKLNSLYENFKSASQRNHEQLAHANEVRKKMWRKSFVKVKPNIFKNIDFLPVSKSISKSREAYNFMTNNINHFKEIVDQA
uniref:CCHC-type domain-containing protein n=1 Tax=Tanacetum cinerariifolium TaxID=118510 RepID=A0A6L2LA48_TANCI|nr:hypothetical protein [Tanacetum cinerariifolium]